MAAAFLTAKSGKFVIALGIGLFAAGVGYLWRLADGERPPAPAGFGRMSVAEAYRVLELRPGASADDIKNAHRRLMKEAHPDHGGSNERAARLNAAKELLIARA